MMRANVRLITKFTTKLGKYIYPNMLANFIILILNKNPSVM